MVTLLQDVKDGCFVFVVGAVGGSVFYFVRGALRSSSRGCRLAGGVQAVVTNGAGACRGAAWAGIVAAIGLSGEDCLDVDARVSLPIAWGAANALFSVHKGPRAAVREGLKGAVYGGAAGMAIHGLVQLADSGECSG